MARLKDQESETIEYKESLSEREEAGQTICGFANKKGGKLCFGVKNNGEIIGISNITEKTNRDITQFLYENLEPKIYFSLEKQSYGDKDIIEVSVKASLQPIHTFKEIPYIRMGSSTRKMSQDEYQRRLIYYKSTNKDYSSTVIPDAKISDLFPEAIKELRKLLSQSGRYKVNINKLSDLQLLKNLLLIQGGQLTIACLVLLGSEEALSRHLPYSEIRYGYKVDENEVRNQDMEVFKGGYFLNYKRIWEKINSRNITINIPFGLRLIEKKAFDEETIREAINNAVVHRDYFITSSVFIIQYPFKIVIRSPGGFPEGVTIDNIINETKPRNKLVADILFKCEMVEQFGNGVNLMYKNQLSLGKLPPNYLNSNENKVELDLDGKVQDIEFAKYVLKVAEEKNKDLSDKELIVLNKINNRQKVWADEITTKLLELGLIERVGYGKYILSKKYYSDTNKKWEYTKRKGLSEGKYKELILEHLRNFGSGKKQDFVKLFAYELTDDQVNMLLKELKIESKIFFDGRPRSRSAEWKLVNS